MNCKDCVQELNGFLDRELSEAEIAQVEVHLKKCGPCEDLFTFKRELRVLVRECCREDEAPSSLRDSVKKLRHS